MVEIQRSAMGGTQSDQMEAPVAEPESVPVIVQPMSSVEIIMELTIFARVEEQYVSNSLFTGGFNTMTRAHSMNKMIKSKAAHLQKAGGTYPGYMEPYHVTELEEMGNVDADGGTIALLPPPGASNKMARRLPLVKSMTHNHTGDWDQNKWFYGYGNAIWSAENRGDGMNPAELNSKPWWPLKPVVHLSPLPRDASSSSLSYRSMPGYTLRRTSAALSRRMTLPLGPTSREHSCVNACLNN
jgi:hypothetical protein